MSRLSLAIHGTGLIIAYSMYGVLQEKILKGTYGANNERFTSSSLLVLCNRLFSIIIAVFIIKTKGMSLSRPTNMSAFAIVASLNYAATSFQYLALQHLSFTTTSLAKCIKMIPVIIVQRLIYKKSSRTRDWIAAIVIVVGCSTYLLTIQAPSILGNDAATHDAIIGTVAIFGYLFTDALCSTTQEKYFGRTSTSTDPFAAESSVLPQMLYVNIFSSIFSLIGVLMNFHQGKVPTSINLLLRDKSLQIDVLALSASASFGLVILLNSIASFGALTTSLIMTIRQFLGILLNAGVFSHFSEVGLEGWTGVGWVASGVYIKMNRTYDEPPTFTKIDLSGEEEAGRRSDSPEPSPPYTSNSNRSSFSDFSEPVSSRRLFYQYFIPILLPVVFSSIIWILSPSNEPAFVDTTILEGRLWEKELHSTLLPGCAPSNASATVRWEGKRRTVLASFPRSGNTLTRELVERVTNFQTSTVSYCDEFLRETFLGECDHSAKFLSKSHYPWSVEDIDVDYRKQQHYDQAVHLVRNPIDALFSDWHLAASPKKNGQLDHSARIQGGGLLGSGRAQEYHVIRRAKIWNHHQFYWHNVSIPVHQLRYEELMNDRLTSMMSLITFLLPNQNERPDLAELSCMTELDESRSAYKSRRSKIFASWDLWEPSVRKAVLEIVKEGWCRNGYQNLLEEERPDVVSGIVC